MSIACLFTLFVTTYHPLVVDSLIFTIDIEKMEAKEQTVSGTIIDYCIDDFLYVLTGRALYKLDCTFLTIEDHIPLPQRFNYLAVNNAEIILITTNEIVIIDKHNFAFKRGIGIEQGDYRPMTILDRAIPAERANFIYLIVDSGTKSILKIFDLKSGELRRKLTVDKIVSIIFNEETHRFITLDINNRLTTYDMLLKKKKSVGLQFEGVWFDRFQHGYMVYSPHGVFFVNQSGKVIDFQAITFEEKSINDKFILLTKKGIVFLDSLTLRPKGFFHVIQRIKKLLTIQAPHAQYVIMLDTHYRLQIINIASMEIQSITKKKMVAKEAALIAPARTDSLWYFQLGAFANYENAVEMYNNVKNNIPVFIDSADLYRVKFGGFHDKMSAIEIIGNLDGWFLFHEKVEQASTIQFSVDAEKYILEDGIIRKE
ncbi:hypothetical protein AMJ74_00360 [candidate division WOR_3 bacterium SM1_77]|uniref:SPOR domain-containing protein n=1 Tax=candidate division WOR_3 bacterium SM1_77 TaxID=1703778 RepID=A0A0S8K4S4_UNCW3|nr:MAG: hypothetical protein AMJ74_00360 [candidate division WOR_3 bacterium SM1_77]